RLYRYDGGHESPCADDERPLYVRGHGETRRRAPQPRKSRIEYGNRGEEPAVKLSVKDIRAWEHKWITLLGMSGVGKPRLAHRLRRRNWFHYSGHYRIGTRYLDEPILDNIKAMAMQVPVLRDLLRSDSIYISNNITFDNLQPVSSFLGKLGDPERGGL